MTIGFDILYESRGCLLVNKPGGVLTQSPPGIDSLEDRIKQFIKQRDDKPGKVYLGVPHRLDRPASGAMVFAKNARAARRLSEQFEGRLVEKIYWALAAGTVEPSRDTWRDWIRKIPDQAKAEIVASEHPEGREAVLHYRVLWSGVVNGEPVNWLRIELETGRTHQVRVQAAARGHPLLGDHQYDSPVAFGPQEDDPRRRWIALHARRLAFEDPMTREPVCVTAPLPAAWATLGLPEVGDGE